MNLLKFDGIGGYSPVDENFRKFLEEVVTNRNLASVRFKDGSDERNFDGVRVIALINENNAEYLQLMASGNEVLLRLDVIISVNERSV